MVFFPDHGLRRFRARQNRQRHGSCRGDGTESHPGVRHVRALHVVLTTPSKHPESDGHEEGAPDNVGHAGKETPIGGQPVKARTQAVKPCRWLRPATGPISPAAKKPPTASTPKV
ncbi:hypothetical protein Nans01_12080 [Nocardiopsis ansamitocini]|uniref:Uncharacterized protein n=1 Tax=Nocardiopsis ansamitocini TaxID=1670832 RepID=A0A9W6P4B8_9ACTN|nr:hypothetical protein Nans01_12080 [Nocardiopsis ansamitocini]